MSKPSAKSRKNQSIRVSEYQNFESSETPKHRNIDSLVKIGQASKLLGVHIDTLRRWTRSGKLKTQKSSGGTRFYSLKSLKKIKPEAFEDYSASSQTTEELLERASEETTSSVIPSEARNLPSLEDPSLIVQDDKVELFKKALVTKFLIGTAAVLVVTTGLLVRSYLTHPESPISDLRPLTSDILAVTASPNFLEINSETQINGSLAVRDSINGAIFEATPSASTITIASGGTTLTISDSATLDQDVSTTSTPTFTSLTLSATTNQLASGGFQFTLPGATTTLVGTDTTQTLTNKSLSGSANTFTNIPNSALVNKKVTVTAGTNLTGGGDVELGSSITISAKDSPSFSGVVLLSDGTAAAPGLAFSSDTDTGLYRIGANNIALITGGTSTQGISIDSSGNVGLGTISPTTRLHVVGTGNITGNVTLGGTLGVTGTTTLSSTLTVTGNTTIDTDTFFVDSSSNRVGIGTTTPGSTLGVQGNVGIGVSYSTLVTPTNGLAVEGNVGIGTTSPLGQLDVSNSFYTGTGELTIRPGNSTNEGGQINLNSPSSTYPGNITIDSFQGLLRFFQANVNPTAVIEWDLTYGSAIFRLGAHGNANAGTITGFSTINAAGTTDLNLNTVTSGNILLSPAGGGNVGIGVTTPGARLQINGNQIIGFNTTTALTGPINGLAVSGNVGIGTTTASYNLSVIGTGNFTGQLTAADGTASAPAYSFSADTDTGLWRVGTNLLALTTGGGAVNGLAVNSSGNVGIGTTSPTTKLYVVGQTTVTDDILASTGSIDIGTSAIRFGTGYFDTVDATNLAGVVTGSGTENASWTINQDYTGPDAENGSLAFERGSSTPNAVLGWDSTNKEFDLNSTLHLTGTIAGNVGINLDATTYDITTPSGEHLSIFPGLGGTAGNVGIGTTGPGAQLSVASNATIGFGGASTIAGPSSGLAVSGNVGVGTTSPLQTLHVVGQCVASGTRIRRRRRMSDGQIVEEDIPVEEIQPSDEVLSLNDQTGAWEWHTVEKTMDMGIQEVFRLETEGGKWIETTANHPYLVREELFEENQNSQQDSYGNQSKSNTGFNINIFNIYSSTFNALHNLLLNVTATNNARIPNSTLIVNTQGLNLGLFETRGTINAAPNQPADRLIKRSDRAISQMLSISSTLPYHGKWIKISQLKVGQAVATYAGWEKIVSIQNVGRKQTYDLQIEGTHNFVGNNIVAHNTYITGVQQSGDGTASSPAYSFTADTNSGLWRIGSDQIALTTGGGAMSGLAINSSGNVGIGTTGPGQKLSVDGVVGVWNANEVNFYTDSGTTLRGYVGAGRNNDISLVSNTVNWLRIGTNNSNIAFFVDGTVDTGDAPQVFINTSGNLGVGTISPGSKLSVLGNVGIGVSFATTVMPTDGLGVQGNVGIGTSTTSNALQVVGSTVLGFTPSAAGPSSGLAVSGNVGIGITTANSTLSVAGSAHIGGIRQGISAPTDGLFVDGNVGIGATTSSNLLDVWGNARITGTLTVDGSTTSGGVYLAPDGTPSAPAYSFSSDTNSGLYRFASDGIALVTGGPSANLLSLNSSGNVGIGTTSPTRILELARDLNPAGTNASLLGADGTQFAISGSTFSKKLVLGLDTTDNFGVIQAGNTDGTNYDFFINPAGGNVGIGSTANNIGGSIGRLYVAGNGTTHAIVIDNNTNLSTTTTAGVVHATLGMNTSNQLALNTGTGTLLVQTQSATRLQFTNTGPTFLSNSNGVIFQGSDSTTDVTIDNNGIYLASAKGIGVGYATSVTLPSSGLAVSGNVGVGTTSPLQALHVVGQCVSWNTRIRIRRKRSRNKFGMTDKNADDAIEYDYLEVMIKDILPGDEVLSLNEITQEFEYQKVEKLLDMGIKGVYELITKSGRTIKTTGNHPYLVHLEGEKMQLHLRGGIAHQSPIEDAGWVKVINLSVGDQIAVAGLSAAFGTLTQSGIEHDDNSHQTQSANNIESLQRSNYNIHQLNLLNIQMLANQKSILSNNPANISSILTSSLFVKKGITTEAKNTNPTFPNSSENLSSWESLNFIFPTLSEIESPVNQMIWDEIISIKYLGYEHVYDLQIANTHNFVGNNIVAHNTYITGVQQSGDGTASSPAYSFTTDTNSGLWRIGSDQIALTTGGGSHSGLSINSSGNVGIGTTSATSILQVSGQATIYNPATNSKSLVVQSPPGGNRGGIDSSGALELSTDNSTNINILPAFTNNLGLFSVQRFSEFIDTVISISSERQTISVAPVTYTITAGYTNQRFTNFAQPTISAASALTVTNASTVYIADAPTTAGAGPASITNPYALWVDGGTSRFDGTTLLALDSGNVGIGASFPQAKLGITGNVGIGVSFGYSSVIPANGLAVQGNVGIGITTANSTLSVAGNAHIGSLYQGISAPTNGLFVDGNVGIGATTSSNLLDVWGNARITGTLTVDSTSTFGGNLTLSGNLLPNADDTYDLGSNTLRWDELFLGPSTLHIGSSTSDEYTLSYDTSNNRLGFNVNGSGPAEIVMDSSGNLGIGTTGPSALFQVNPNASNPFVVQSGGNIGIGWTSPNNPLEVRSTTTPQMRVGYDSSNYFTTSVASGGAVTFDSVFTSTGNCCEFFFADQVLVGGTSDFGVGPGDVLAVNGNMRIVSGSALSVGQITGQNFITLQSNTGGSVVVRETENLLEARNTAGGRLAILTYTGNLGIGNTSVNTMLAVAGNATIGFGGASSSPAGPSSGLAVSGNVGVGTTSPLQALHVVGQCVAEGTRIRRRRKNTSGVGSDSPDVDEWEEVPVEDIREDDEILSLNDKQSLRSGDLKTGAWEWHQVEKTMDMGIQEVFRLETEGGKWIETTANHPYLVIEEEELLSQRNIGQYSQEESYSQKSKSYTSFIIDIFNHFLSFGSHTSLNINDRTNANIPLNILYVNNLQSSFALLDTIGTTITALPIQAADKLTENSDNVANNLLNTIWSTDKSIAQVEKAVWIKVHQLKIGMLIATVDGWEKIVSITNAGRVKTYDLQIEGTHNFVGNNIVAHNTYITGVQQSGDGTASSPAYSFSADTDTGLWRPGTNIVALTTAGSAPAGTTISGLSVNSSGNVGIATTNPSQLFEVSGSINGNVIGVVTNLSGGASALAEINVRNDTANQTGLRLVATGTSWTGSAPFVQDAGVVAADSALTGGLSIAARATGTGSVMRFYTGGDTERMRIDSNGNLGIGTASPTNLFHVSGGNVGIGVSTATSTLAVNGNSTIGWGLTGVAGPSSGLAVSGNVGVGVTTANAKLHVYGTGGTNDIYQIIASNADTGFRLTAASTSFYAFQQFFQGSTGQWELGVDPNDVFFLNNGTNQGSASSEFTVSSSGNVGIGDSATTNPAAQLYISQTGAGDALRIEDAGADTTSVFVVNQDGNVGIANSAPSYTLDVIGSTRFSTSITQAAGQFLAADGTVSLPAYSFSADTNSGLYRFASDGIALITGGASANLLSLNSSGNVGVGTTTPLQALHVVGQCVTGDTKLRRRRRTRRRQGYGGQGKDDEWLASRSLDEGWEEVRIDQIQAGDEILSMEPDGTFDWRKVNNLMDMGRQETYKLITNKGKQIRTTGNHPYFVLEKRPVKELKELYTTFEVDQSNRLENMGVDSVVALTSDETDQIVTVKISKGVKRAIFKKHYNNKRKLYGPEMIAILIIYAIWDLGLKAGRLVIDREYPNYEDYISTFITRTYPEIVVSFKSIGHQATAHRAAWSRATKKKTPTRSVLLKTMASLDFNESLAAELLHPGLVTGDSQSTRSSLPILYQSPLSLSRGEMSDAKWTPARTIRKGMLVATVDGWEVITAIYQTGVREQVWDIEVEGTHNFVGNNIVAHNTYITGVQQSGDGTASSPAYSFTADTDTGLFRPSTNALGFATAGASRMSITASGNVGIGITSPSFPLEVALSGDYAMFGGGGSTAGLLIDRNANASSAEIGFLDWRGRDTAGGNDTLARIAGGIQTSSATTPSGFMGLYTANTSGTLTEAIRINQSQNVGIGDATPVALLSVGSGDLFVVTSVGNVGIGFTTPDRLLQTASDINIVGSNASLLGAAGTQFAITGGSATGLQKKLVLGIDTTDNFGVIQAGSTDGTNYNLSLNPAGGNVGIGTTNPQALFQVNYSSSNPVVITSAGNVGIGTTIPAQALDVTGNIAASGTFRASNSGYTFTDDTDSGFYRSISSVDNSITLILGGTNRMFFGTNGVPQEWRFARNNFFRWSDNISGSAGDIQINSPGAGQLQITSAALSGGADLLTLTQADHTSVTSEIQTLAVDGPTITITAAYTNQRFSQFDQPTISAASALTVTNASTVYIADAPTTAGAGPASITNPYALWIDGGTSRFDGTTLLAQDSGNVGIGASFPQAKLGITGNVGIGVSFGYSSVIPTNGLAVQGNVGIGTSTTSQALHVIGSGQFSTSILNADGTASSPAYSFTADTDTGLFRPGTNALGFSTGGSSQMTITAAGNVGIGTTAPEQLLHIAGNIGIDSNSTINTRRGGSAAASIQFGDSATDNEVLILRQSSTARGIYIAASGTAMPTTYVTESRFGVDMRAAFNAAVSIGSTYESISASSMPTNGLLVEGNVGIGFTTPTALLHLVQTASGNAFRVDDVANDTSPFVVNLDGNVGIANSAPSYTLDVIGTSRFSTSITQAAGQFLAADGTASLPAYSFSADTNSGLWRIGSDQIALTTGGSAFSGLSINSSGNIGIGTTSATGIFQVNPPAAASGAGGSILLTAQQGASGGISGGAVTLTSGSNTSGGGSTGAISLTVGGGVGSEVTGGAISLTAGSSVGSNRTGGAITLTTGAGANTNGAGGAFSVTTGAGGGANTSGAGNGGAISLTTGAAGDGDASVVPSSGALSLITGGGGGADNWNTGALTLRTGAANGSGTAGSILFQTNGANTRMAVHGGGNVGVGTSVPGSLFVVTGGNLGIGVSATGAALQVNDGGIFWASTTALTPPTNGLAVQGNVGVGTTSPLQALHVVGQCVSWNTRIRIRRRRRSSLRGGEDDEAIYDYLEVMIKDILEGDEVLSLNEITQEFEYQSVEKLLDMGIKGVYELTTKSGRTIKTTGNHPYLTRFISKESPSTSLGTSKPTFEVVHQSPIKDAGWVKVMNLSVGDQIAVAGLPFSSVGLPTSHIDYNKSNNQQSSSNISESKNSTKIVHNSSILVSAQTPAYQDTIAPSKFLVNSPALVAAIVPINQTTTKLEQTAENIRNLALADNSITSHSTTEDYTFQWDEVVSIKYLGYEHVYDLQVENTHNFVGNNIVAHNTYITGNVGIGTSTPTTPLMVVGGGEFRNTASSNDVIQLSANDTNIGFELRSGTSLGTPFIDFANDATTDFDGRIILTGDNTLLIDGADLNMGSNQVITNIGNAGTDFNTSGGLTLAAALQLPDGTAAAPGLTFSADTDTGLFRPSTNALGFSTGGTSRSTITAAGNVGIGNTNPSALLELTGNLLFTRETNRTISVQDSTTSNTAGANLTLSSAGGIGTGAGGALALTAGSGGESGVSNGGAINLTGGIAGQGTGAQGGAVNLIGGARNVDGSNDGGAVAITGGLGATGRAGGAITLTSGAADNGAFQGSSGAITIRSAVGPNTSGGTNGGNSGTLTLATGNGGTSGSATGGNAGNILLTTGAGGTGSSSGNTGYILFQNGSALSGIFNSSGNLGIGLTNPSQLFQINSSTSNPFVVTSGGNVGIGFTTPDRLLQTASDINIVGSNASLLGAAGTQFAITGSSATGLQKKLVLGIDTTDNYGVIQAGNTDGTNYTLALNPAGGNVGIGTTSPGSPLQVNGQVAIFAVDNQTLFQETDGPVNEKYWSMTFDGGNLSWNTYDDPINNINEFFRISRTERIVDQTEFRQGNVGIADGVITTSAQLHVQQTSAADAFRVDDVSGDTTPFLIDQTGNVGIGFTSPGSQLDVFEDTSTSDVDVFRILTNVGGTGNVKFRIDSDGDLFTDGTTTIGNPADVAENYPVLDSSIEAGDVVAVANTSNAENPYLEKSALPYQNNLIGIISTKPGVILSGNTQGKPVTLAGRVPVKISTENGPIEKGDFLTSSSTRGVAMKATRPGPTVGKALEEFNPTPGVCAVDTPGVGCVGKILAFVNVSYADPNNFFASLSFDNQGNLIIPKLKVGSLMLDPSLATASAQLTAGDSQLALSTDPAYTSPGPNLSSNNNNYIDLGGTIASLEDRLAQLEIDNTKRQAQIKNLQDILGNVGIGTREASSSSSLADSLTSNEASNSATPSAHFASSEASSSSSLANQQTSNDVTSLDLTPPDILLYTGSATLTNLTVKSEATMSGVLTAYQAEIKDHFKVLGQTTLADTLVAGDLTIDGTLTFSANSINAIGISQGQTLSTQGLSLTNGILYLQRSPLAQGLDIFNGKVTIDKEGQLKAVTLVADQIKINEGKSAGKGLIPAGQTEVVVENEFVEESSLIFITSHTPLLQTLAITDKTDKSNTTNKTYGTFKVKLSHPEPQDITFDYLIVGIEKKLSSVPSTTN